MKKRKQSKKNLIHKRVRSSNKWNINSNNFSNMHPLIGGLSISNRYKPPKDIDAERHPEEQVFQINE